MAGLFVSAGGECRRVKFQHMVLVMAGLAIGLPGTTMAAPAKKKTAAKSSKSTAKPATKAAAKPAPVPPKPIGFMVPKAVVLRNPTAAEQEANAVWNVRAALNVGALQCQYSRWLDTVKNYNSALKHHGDEFTAAQQTMIGHFRRTDGARANNSFDQYTTRTYNSFSTLDAQYSFCNIVGRVGREVLALPKGTLGANALKWLPEIRTALTNLPLSSALAFDPPAPLVIEPIAMPEP